MSLLNPAPDLSFVSSHTPAGRNGAPSPSTTQRTNLVVSLHPTTYAILVATKGEPTTLDHDNIKLTAHRRPCETQVRFYPHHKSVLGPKYSDIASSDDFRTKYDLGELSYKTSQKGYKTPKGGPSHLLTWVEALVSSHEVTALDAKVEEERKAARTAAGQQQPSELDRLEQAYTDAHVAATTAHELHTQAAAFAEEMQSLVDSMAASVDDIMGDEARADAEAKLVQAQQEAAAAVAKATELQKKIHSCPRNCQRSQNPQGCCPHSLHPTVPLE